MTLQNFTLGTFSQGAVAGGSFESIATVTGNGSATELTFSGIPGTYKHLQIRGIARDTNGFNVEDLKLIFNSDTSSNYNAHEITGNGTSAAATGGYSYAFVKNAVAGQNLTANIVGASIIDIHDYASTTRNKTIRSFSGMDANTGSTVSRVSLSSSLWINTSAITSITIKTVFGYIFSTTSTFALYGIKGA